MPVLVVPIIALLSSIKGVCTNGSKQIRYSRLWNSGYFVRSNRLVVR